MKNATTKINKLHFSSHPCIPESSTLKLKMHNECGYPKEEDFVIGKVLGRGSYAYCIETIHSSSGKVYACKVFKKSKITSYESRMRILIEVSIHKKLNHKHIVKFYSVGSTSDNVFILLEKCNNRTLKQLLSTRRRFQENEVRYFLYQIVEAVHYLHINKICHRDLKLDNIFLNNMSVKLGDFGFAVKLEPEEVTNTFCGTPNYIAPEVINKTGYRMPVDIWAIGVLAYAMLFGSLPFETLNSDTTFDKILKNNYSFPKHPVISDETKDLIKSCLSHHPKDRPTSAQLLKHPFFGTHFALNPVCISGNSSLLSLISLENLKKRSRPKNDVENISKKLYCDKENQAPNFQVSNGKRGGNDTEVGKLLLGAHLNEFSSPDHLDHKNRVMEICSRLQEFCKTAMSFGSFSSQSNTFSKEYYHENLGHHWIVKWVDYSQKFGLAYRFCDGSIGVNYIDKTRMRLYSNNEKLIYSHFVDCKTRSGVDKQRIDKCFDLKRDDQKVLEIPDVGNKFKILNHFARYMSDFSESSGLSVNCRANNNFLPSTGLLMWVKRSTFIAFLFTNYTIQVSFFNHEKIVISFDNFASLDGMVVTWIGSKDSAVTRMAHEFIQQGFATLYIIGKFIEILDLLTLDFA